MSGGHGREVDALWVYVGRKSPIMVLCEGGVLGNALKFDVLQSQALM